MHAANSSVKILIKKFNIQLRTYMYIVGTVRTCTRVVNVSTALVTFIFYQFLKGSTFVNARMPLVYVRGRVVNRSIN